MQRDVESGALSFRDPKREKPSTKLDHIRLTESDNGGWTAEHHFQGGPSIGSYAEPKLHVFSKGEGGKFLAHIGKHLGIAGAEEEAGEPKHNKKEY